MFNMNCVRNSLFLLGKNHNKLHNVSQNQLYSLVSFPTTLRDNIEKPKTGILMLNMGGPTSTDQVHDYLLRIMTDTDMIQLPMQSTLGPLIAKRRTADVQKKYSEIGGGSPILKWTKLQGELMCRKLDRESPSTAPHQLYIAFRYIDPLTEATLEEIERDNLDQVVIFSQYPQYSCATGGSSLNAIYSYYKDRPLPEKTKWSLIERWSTHPLLAKAIAARIQTQLNEIQGTARDETLLVFSAHSLPLKAVVRGDSYPYEVGATMEMVMKELKYVNPYCLVWQSKVGPLPWLSPATDEALKAFVQKGKKNFILIPIAFVNEHIETLHEMDIEYCTDLAAELGPDVVVRRAAAPNDHPFFIEALVDLVKTKLESGRPLNSKFLQRCAGCMNPRCEKSKNWYSQLCTGKQT